MTDTKVVGNDICKLTFENLKKLSTKRLLNIKRISYTNFSLDDYFFDCDCDECKRIAFRIDFWDKMIKDCKKILAEREHIPPKGKRKKKA